jgi:polysaccharide biosynthesis/export protein
MIKIKILIFITFSILSGCATILEPVSIAQKIQNNSTLQEEFSIEVKSLTFKEAVLANKTPYSRELMLTGSGASANVIKEEIFLQSNFPKSLKNKEYTFGIGDELSYISLNEFITEDITWPKSSQKRDYELGVGDGLRFVQMSDGADVKVIFENGLNSGQIKENDNIMYSSGIVGSNGNVLLLGVGNIKAAGRTLNKIRTEIRNILIRNGLAPNFQLEIDSFKSKKAYLSNGASESRVITINNIPISLKEIALGAGLSESLNKLSLISLTRNRNVYRITAGQLFDKNAPEVFIQDKDEIVIEIALDDTDTTIAIVGSSGKVLLPTIGGLSVINKTLKNVQDEVRDILIKKGIRPNFQLELSKSRSKKAYLIQKDVGSEIMPVTDKKISLKEVILQKGIISKPSTGLSIVKLIRNNKEYYLTIDSILDPKSPNIWIQSEDQIEIANLLYKPGQVFALSGMDTAKILTIDPSSRESLANILFTQGGALNNSFARRSEIYLLRGQNPSIAYHLDTQNVSRILVAAKTELRPNDIVFVAERPIISFTRTLAELNPLRELLRDIQDGKIP